MVLILVKSYVTLSVSYVRVDGNNWSSNTVQWRSFRKPYKYIIDDNIIMDPREMRWEVVDWIQLAKDRYQ